MRRSALAGEFIDKRVDGSVQLVRRVVSARVDFAADALNQIRPDGRQIAKPAEQHGAIGEFETIRRTGDALLMNHRLVIERRPRAVESADGGCLSRAYWRCVAHFLNLFSAYENSFLSSASEFPCQHQLV